MINSSIISLFPPSGALGEVHTAAHAALLSICIFCFNAFPFAVSIAGTIRVGNLLGAGMWKQVRLRLHKICPARLLPVYFM